MISCSSSNPLRVRDLQSDRALVESQLHRSLTGEGLLKNYGGSSPAHAVPFSRPLAVPQWDCTSPPYTCSLRASAPIVPLEGEVEGMFAFSPAQTLRQPDSGSIFVQTSDCTMLQAASCSATPSRQESRTNTLISSVRRALIEIVQAAVHQLKCAIQQAFLHWYASGSLVQGSSDPEHRHRSHLSLCRQQTCSAAADRGWVLGAAATQVTTLDPAQ